MTIAIVGTPVTNEQSTTLSSPFTYTVSKTTTGGNCLVALFAIASSSLTVSSISDTGGNTWTNIAKAVTSGNNNRVEAWYSPNAAAITSITVTMSGGLRCSTLLMEFSGVATSSVLDPATAVTTNSASTTTGSPNITTVLAGTVVISGKNHNLATTGSLTWSGATTNTHVGSAAGRELDSAYKIQTSAGTESITWTVGSTSLGTLSFGLAAAAGGGSVNIGTASSTGASTSAATVSNQRPVASVSDAGTGASSGEVSNQRPVGTASSAGVGTSTATLSSQTPISTVSDAGTSTTAGTVSNQRPIGTISDAGTSTTSGTVANATPIGTISDAGTGASSGTVSNATSIGTVSDAGTGTSSGTLASATPIGTISDAGTSTSAGVVSNQRPIGTVSDAGAGTTSGVVSASTLGQILPYDVASPWNTLIGSQPLDPKSSTYITAISDNGLALTSDPSQFTPAVYIVSDSTPLKTVSGDGFFGVYDSGDASRVGQGSPWHMTNVPIPDTAEPVPGSDSQVVFWDPVAGVEWGFWQFRATADVGGLAAADWYASNGYRYHTLSGTFHYYGRMDAGTASNGRGMGTPYLAGTVRRWEVEQGIVAHALTFGYASPSSAFVYPASKSDGGNFGGVLGTDLPEGARIRIDPAKTDSDFAGLGLNTSAIVLARALRDYGAYVCDHSGSSKIYLESNTTAGWGGDISSTMMSAIPWSWFRVVTPPAQPPGVFVGNATSSGTGTTTATLTTNATLGAISDAGTSTTTAALTSTRVADLGFAISSGFSNSTGVLTGLFVHHAGSVTIAVSTADGSVDVNVTGFPSVVTATSAGRADANVTGFPSVVTVTSAGSAT